MALIHRIRALFRGRQISRAIDEELEYHLSMREASNRNSGMPNTEARTDARRRFGNLTLLKESTREQDLMVAVDTIVKDLGFAGRMLAKHPGFTALAVVALALGIGVNTAVFTTLKAVLFQPLDAKDAARLVNIYHSNKQSRYVPHFSYPDFEFYRDHSQTLSGVVATISGEFAMSSRGSDVSKIGASDAGIAQAFGFRLPTILGGGSQYVSVAGVSDNYFAVLGAQAARGRVFLPKMPTISISTRLSSSVRTSGSGGSKAIRQFWARLSS